jgi:sugar phosphate isomerase/epimerase
VTPATALGPDDLIAAYLTLARVDRTGVARVPFEARVAMAAAAGFAAVAVLPDDHRRSVDGGLSEAQMVDTLARHDIVVAEIDGAPWWPDHERGPLRRRQDEAMRVAETFAARHLIAPMPAPATPVADEELAERLADLCDRASSLGLLVGLECLPWTPVRDVGHAWRVVQLAGRPNAGLTVDFWHHRASEMSDDVFDVIPGERVVAVHVTDGVRDRSLDPLTETKTCRRLAGDGEFGVERLVRRLDASGVRAPLTVEIVSLSHRRLEPAELIRLVHDTTRAVVDRARRGEGGQ